MPNAPEVPPTLIEWDRSQREVINRPVDDRLLVDAGPGTGKTAVACARVSRLIDQAGLVPGNIWLISFTRTAVREIRDRIASFLQDSEAAHAITITTLDSQAWAIHSGFNEGATILDSYDKNIVMTLELIQTDESVSNYLSGVEHLIVDEAQDIVGPRAELVISIIRKLPMSCGVTVFADEAQAIYGFSDDADVSAGHPSEAPLPARLSNGEVGPFQKCGLTSIHRTDSRELLQIFSNTRRRVLEASQTTDDKLRKVRDEVAELAHGKAPSADSMTPTDHRDTFVLYRRRCDVLLASSFLMENSVPHRVRMSGLPVCLVPWIGATLSEHTEANLTRDGFMALWAARVHNTSLATCEPDDAWKHLVRVAGRSEELVDIRRLRGCLGRKQPPAELCHTELGVRGPIVGTIHASKGRETNKVHLMLPKLHTAARGVNQDEEARVVFVGATRARSRLLTGSGYSQVPRRLESGRTYCLHTARGQAKAQFEIGHESDISASGLAGRRYFSVPDDVRRSQKRIRGLMDTTAPLLATIDRDADFVYRLRESNDHDICLAVLSPSVMKNDLFAIAGALQQKLRGSRRRPPDKIKYIFGRGVRTIILQPEAPEAETLHEPWRSSGIMLAPVILGYSTSFFPIRKT